MADKKQPEAPEAPMLSLSTLGQGAAMELFEQELERVLENILDPNTEAKAKRTITLTVSITPAENRHEAAIGVEAACKLAPFKGASGIIFVGRQRGKAVALAHNPNQLQMAWDEESKPIPLAKTAAK